MPSANARPAAEQALLPDWLRRALMASVPLNAFGALIMAPPFPWVRRLVGLPEPEHPVYLWLVSLWIGAFGYGYYQLARSGRPERTYLEVTAFGKATFFFAALWYWWQGSFSVLVPMGASADLALVVCFVTWLVQTRN